jgi:hypothetical protein
LIDAITILNNQIFQKKEEEEEKKKRRKKEEEVVCLSVSVWSVELFVFF